MGRKRREEEEIRVLKDIDRTEHEILDQLKPHLSFVKISFLRGECMAEGPLTITVGQKTVASIDAFDQNGAPFTGTIPTPTWSIDQPTLDTIAADQTNPQNEDVTSTAAGVANLTLTVQGPNGPLTDTETITNVAQSPVLSSVKINFSTPA